jgi:chaperonin cofactor prefoldin
MQQEDADRINGAFAHTNSKIEQLTLKISNLERRITIQQQEFDMLKQQYYGLLARTFNGGSTSGDIN